MKYPLEFTLNGMAVEVYVKPTETLLDVLREHLKIKSPKRGCDCGDCGACTVMINGEAMKSCIVLALTTQGKQVITIEGFMKDGELDPLQEAFYEKNAAQCGFCTSGMLVSAKSLLEKNPSPDKEEIMGTISGNLCRCGSYVEIANAVASVAANATRKE